MKRIIKGRGFTDKLYFLNFFAVWVFTWACFIITIFSGVLGITDMAIASVGVPAAFTELGLHTAFIIWKAKTENIAKYNPEKIGEDY